MGGIEEIPINARIFAATSLDLKAAAEKGEFRQELYYRLNILEINVTLLPG